MYLINMTILLLKPGKPLSHPTCDKAIERETLEMIHNILSNYSYGHTDITLDYDKNRMIIIINKFGKKYVGHINFINNMFEIMDSEYGKIMVPIFTSPYMVPNFIRMPEFFTNKHRDISTLEYIISNITKKKNEFIITRKANIHYLLTNGKDIEISIIVCHPFTLNFEAFCQQYNCVFEIIIFRKPEGFVHWTLLDDNIYPYMTVYQLVSLIKDIFSY